MSSIGKKESASRVKVIVSVGFLYWIGEQSNLRGLKNIDILKYKDKLTELFEEYATKYPNGLTGFRATDSN